MESIKRFTDDVFSDVKKVIALKMEDYYCFSVTYMENLRIKLQHDDGFPLYHDEMFKKSFWISTLLKSSFHVIERST